MNDLVTIARLNDEQVIREALRALGEKNYMRFAKILTANRDLAVRIMKAVEESGVGRPKEE